MENRIGEIHLSKEKRTLKIVALGETNKTGNKTYFVQYENGEISKTSYVYYAIKSNKVTNTPRRIFKNKNHQLYPRWKSMMERCYRSKHVKYQYYGARGVTVCDRWHNFDNFVYDVDNHLLNGHLLYEKGYDLDKDLKGSKVYNLENCDYHW